LGDEEFDALKVGDRIKVEIQKSRFQLRDPFIVSVGMYRGMSGMPTRVNVAPVKSVNSEVPVNEIVAKLEEEDANVSGDEASAEEEEDEEAAEE
jgi:hypothetical protein